MKRISADQLWAGRNFNVAVWRDDKPEIIFASDEWKEALSAYRTACDERPTEHITLRTRAYLNKERGPIG